MFVFTPKSLMDICLIHLSRTAWLLCDIDRLPTDLIEIVYIARAHVALEIWVTGVLPELICATNFIRHDLVREDAIMAKMTENLKNITNMKKHLVCECTRMCTGDPKHLDWFTWSSNQRTQSL